MRSLQVHVWNSLVVEVTDQYDFVLLLHLASGCSSPQGVGSCKTGRIGHW